MYNQKELNLLQNMQQEEELCVEKYRKYADSAATDELKNLMNKIGDEEQEHFNTISKLISGDVPKIDPTAPKSPAHKAVESINACNESYRNNNEAFKSDRYLCSDALGTEKHVSSVYNVGIFEFKNEDVREVLNHIQKEEQQHGEKLYNYMAVNGMYEG